MIILRQKYYSDNKERNNDEESTGKKIAKGAAQVAGGTTLAGLAGAEVYQYGKGLQRDLLRARRHGYYKESKEAFDKFLKNPGDVDALNKYKKIEDKISKSLDKENKESKLEKFGHKVEDKVEDKVRKTKQKIKDKVEKTKAGKWLLGETEKDKARIKKRMDERIDKIISNNKDFQYKDKGKMDEITAKEYKRAKNINRLGKAAMIATPIAVAGGTALALRKKNKKEE